MDTMASLRTCNIYKGLRAVSCTEVYRKRAKTQKYYLYSSVHGKVGAECMEVCINMYMKRLNPKTNAPFKRGDVREDGRVFYNYTNTVKANGFFVERWLTKASSENAMEYDRNRKNASYVRKTDRMPKGYAKVLKYDTMKVSLVKNAWRQKCSGKYSAQELHEEYSEHPDILGLLNC